MKVKEKKLTVERSKEGAGGLLGERLSRPLFRSKNALFLGLFLGPFLGPFFSQKGTPKGYSLGVYRKAVSSSDGGGRFGVNRSPQSVRPSVSLGTRTDGRTNSPPQGAGFGANRFFHLDST